MGWFIEPYRGYTVVHHGGNVEGHSLMIGVVPQEKIGVVALTNVAGLPLPGIMLYEGIDQALDLADHDWNRKFHVMVDPLLVATEKAKQTAAEERVTDAPPTHPVEHDRATIPANPFP